MWPATSHVPLLTVVAGVVAILTLIALMVVPRRLAARSSSPVALLINGQVPAAADWLPAALTGFATGYRGKTSWADVEESGVLLGHVGIVELPHEDISCTVRLRPHPMAAEVPRDRPLRVVIELSTFPRCRGAARLLFGQSALRKALDLRDELRADIRDRVRDEGAVATGTLVSRGDVAARICAVILALTGVAALTPYAIELAPRVRSPNHAPSPPAALPSGVKECPVSGTSTAAPPRSAAAKGTSCAVAEKVGAAYRKKAAAPTVEVTIRTSGSAKLTFTCTHEDAWVVCRSGKRIVYLR